MPESNSNSDILLTVGISNEEELRAIINELREEVESVMAKASELVALLKEAELLISDQKTFS